MKHTNIRAKQAKALHKFIRNCQPSVLFPSWVNAVQADLDCMTIKIGGTC